MKLLGSVVLVAFLLAALRLVATVLILSLILTVVIGLVRAPWQTLSVLLGLVLINALAAYPALGLIILFAVIFVGQISK